MSKQVRELSVCKCGLQQPKVNLYFTKCTSPEATGMMSQCVRRKHKVTNKSASVYIRTFSFQKNLKLLHSQRRFVDKCHAVQSGEFIG